MKINEITNEGWTGATLGGALAGTIGSAIGGMDMYGAAAGAAAGSWLQSALADPDVKKAKEASKARAKQRIADTVNILKQMSNATFNNIISSVPGADHYLDASSMIEILADYIGTDGLIDVDTFAHSSLENIGGSSFLGMDLAGEEGDYFDMYSSIANEVNKEIRKRMAA